MIREATLTPYQVGASPAAMQVAHEIVNRSTAYGSHDLRSIRHRLEALANSDEQLARAVHADVLTLLTPVEQAQLGTTYTSAHTSVANVAAIDNGALLSSAESQNEEGEEVIVVGRRLSNSSEDDYLLFIFSSTGAYDNDPGFLEAVHDAGLLDGLPDESVIEVTINVDGELTASQQKAIDALRDSIKTIASKLPSLPDNGTFKLAGGQLVTVAELKQAWAKVDFRVDPPGTQYPDPNGGKHDRGHVAWNNGDPVIGMSLSWLERETNTGWPSGPVMSHFILHELGHTVAVARELMAGGWNEQRDQTLANDVARAIAEYLDIQIRNGSTTPGNWEMLLPSNEIPDRPGDTWLR